MLLELTIQNFAIIKELSLTFSEGLNVLTGETGAGKSIIIGALGLLLGDRAAGDMIRSGEEKAVLDAVFMVENENLRLQLKKEGFLEEEDDLLILSREVSKSGRNLCKMNQRPVTLSYLREVGQVLFDIHGQHQHQSLLNEKNHLLILDAYCKDAIKPIYETYQALYAQKKEMEKELKSLLGDREDREARLSFIAFQIGEITEAALKPGEEEALTDEVKIMANAEKIKSLLYESHEYLYEGTEKTSSILDLLNKTIKVTEHLTEFDHSFENTAKELQDAYYLLEDASYTISDYMGRLDFDPMKLEQCQNRLDKIWNLKKKYGNSIEEILSYRDRLLEEQEKIINNQDLVNDLHKKLDTLERRLKEEADQLTGLRRSFAEKLTDRVLKELKELYMDKTDFLIEFQKKALTETGQDEVRFLVSANVGEELRPLSMVSSGGEISRIMLAMKTAIAEVDQIPTIVFDEVDSGIGGEIIKSVAKKLYEIGKSRQVLCITHSPQIAAYGKTHFYIEKTDQAGRTFTKIHQLKEEKEKIAEIARMLNGKTDDEITLRMAKKLIETVNN